MHNLNLFGFIFLQLQRHVPRRQEEFNFCLVKKMSASVMNLIQFFVRWKNFSLMKMEKWSGVKLQGDLLCTNKGVGRYEKMVVLLSLTRVKVMKLAVLLKAYLY